MTPKTKKIALVAAPLAAFALGWTLRSITQPAQAASEFEEARLDEEAGTFEPAASIAEQKGGAKGKAKGGKKPAPKAGAAKGGAKPKAGGSKPKGGQANQAAKGGKGKPKAAGSGAQKTAKSKAGAKNDDKGGAAKPSGGLQLAQLVLALGGGGKEPAPPGTRVRLVPTDDKGGIGDRLEAWAAKDPQGEDSAALFAEDGVLIPDDGKAEFQVPASVDFTLEVWSESDLFERGEMELGPLVAKRRRPVQIDVTHMADASASANTAAADEPVEAADERPATQHEVADFCGLVVTADAEALPVADARVQDRGETVATTDAEGRFRLAYDPSLAPVVRVVGRMSGPALVQVGPGHETGAIALIVKLRPSAAIAARVLNADGKPVPGVLVTVSTDMGSIVGEETGFAADAREQPTELGEIAWTATTNQLGAVFLEGLPADAPLHIRGRRTAGRGDASGPALAGIPAEVRLAPGEKWNGEWTLPKRPELRGRAIDQAQEPVAGAPIWLVRAEAGALAGSRYLDRDDRPTETQVSELDGSFHFADVEPGLWLLGVGLPPAGDQVPWQIALDHLAQPIEVPELGGPELGEILLRVGRGLTMRGVVLDPAGRAAAGVLVTALEDSGRGVADARTEADGGFTLGPLSEGSYRLLVAGKGSSGIQHYGPIASGSRDLVLQLAESTPLVGVVVAPDGSTHSATVTVFHGGVQRALVRTREPERPGVFEAIGLEPGLYDFIATTEDGQVGVVRDVSVGAELREGAVRVPLAPGGLLTLRGDGSSPWHSFSVLQNGRPIALGILKRGVPRTSYVPAGPLTVRLQASAESAQVERSVDIPRAGNVELDFAREPAAARAPAGEEPGAESSAPSNQDAQSERGTPVEAVAGGAG